MYAECKLYVVEKEWKKREREKMRIEFDNLDARPSRSMPSSLTLFSFFHFILYSQGQASAGHSGDNQPSSTNMAAEPMESRPGQASQAPSHNSPRVMMQPSAIICTHLSLIPSFSAYTYKLYAEQAS